MDGCISISRRFFYVQETSFENHATSLNVENSKFAINAASFLITCELAKSSSEIVFGEIFNAYFQHSKTMKRK